MDNTLHLLVVKTGSTEPQVVARHGDYDDWFRSHFRPLGVQETLCQAWKGESLPRPEAYDGIILTGSPSSVFDDDPWMRPLAEWALAAAESGIPVLAVCFGHQLIGEALGGRIAVNPSGPEYGTIEVEVSEAGRVDPIFRGLPSRFLVQSTHRDALIEPPAARLLASTPNTPWQAFGWGPHLRAVQFHPEIPPEALRALCSAREINAVVREQSQGSRILDNWLEYYVKPSFPAT